MAKQPNGNPTPAPAVKSTSTATPSDQIRDAARLHEEALAANPDAPVRGIEPEPGLDLASALRQATQAKQLWTEGKTTLDRRAAELDKRDAELREKKDRQQLRTSELDKREQNLREEERRLKETDAAFRVQKEEQEKALRLLKDEWLKKKTAEEAELTKREEEVSAKAMDAEAGFLRRRRELLADLEVERERAVDEVANREKSRLASLAAFEQKVADLRQESFAQLESDRAKLHSLQEEARRAKQEAEWECEVARDEKAHYSRRLAEATQQARREFEERINATQDRLNDMARKLGEKEAAERACGGRSVPELLADIDRLRQERSRLENDLSLRASDEQTQRLATLESDNETLRTELAEARRREQSLEMRISQHRIGVAQVQILKDEEAAWKVREAAYQANIAQLKADLERFTDQASNKPPFAELTALDEKLKHAPEEILSDAYPDLQSVIHRAQHAMAQGAENRPPLYYSERALRCFLGGLASNRLHLLQGISGTGKSSLPREFARAFGWESAFVEVQSSWRDKTDLLGYYNAFEKRFYESACLQALYSAQCPAHASRPFFIVLDEMNLSQTEHYFADFLSALEQTSPELRRIGLVGHQLSPSPRLLVEGKAIRIPDNVWFIGTANHDESTKDFADKTYDRAHVMELPRSHTPFKSKPTHIAPLDWPRLADLFEKASRTHAKEAEDALRFLGAKLKKDLSDLDLGWGNRFEKQLRSFLPVVVAAGGHPGEALDHLLATKVLRKLRGKFDLSVQLLEKVRVSLDKSWSNFDSQSPGSESVQLLDTEIRRLGGTAKE